MQAIYKIYMRPLCWIRPERIYKPLLACHTYCHYVCYLYDNHVIIDDRVERFFSFSLSLSLYHNMAHDVNLTPRKFLCAPRMAPLITITPPPHPLPFVSHKTVCHAPRNIHWSVPHWILIRQEKCDVCIQYITIDYGETFHPVLSGNLAFICLCIVVPFIAFSH